MPNYVIALKREFRQSDENYLDSISKIHGVRIKGASNPYRVLVEMTPDAASELTKRFGDRLYIEPEIFYKLA